MKLSKIRLSLITLCFVCMNMSLASSQHNPLFEKDWKFLGRIQTDDFHKTFKKLSELDIDIAGVNIKKKEIDILINDYDYQKLSNEKFSIHIAEVKGITKGPDAEYKTPDEIAEILNRFHSLYPNITKLESIGKSIEGRDIWAMKISDNPDTLELEEPAVLFNSMHHAREVMSPEVSLDIIETLLTKYNTDKQIQTWVNQNQIWILPMFNVDGNNKMWEKDRWWRKNNRGGYGVDLNRNYPTGWNKCRGSSGWRWSQTYRGKNPASEPETQAMMSFVAKIRPVFDISYHSYSELVIYPFGCSPERTPTQEVVERIGKEVASKLDYTAGTAWELLYNADGGDIDWMYDAYQVIPFVIELNSNSEGFQPDYSKWRDKTVKRNRAGWMHLLDRLSQSGVRGVLKLNKNIISDFNVEIRKFGEDKLLQTYKGHSTGVYHLVLNPGDYELRFVQNGSILTKENVHIGNTLEVLNVNL